ncbi:MAG: response regulator [Planctomycetota bacterium]
MVKSKILIVDDDQDLTKAMKIALESEQFTVLSAANRTEGMEKIRNDNPDLIILDVMMHSWSDGFEMSRELKQNPRFKDIPILILTAVKEKSGINFKSTAGDPDWLPVDGFLNKPAEPQVLIAEVKRLLSENT